MDDEELELALEGIERVAHIATTLVYREKRLVCGRLGGELLIVAGHLKSVGAEDDDYVSRKIPKLLRFVERICCWPEDIKHDDFLCLWGIADAIPGTEMYQRIESKIVRGLLEISKGKAEDAECAILHLKRFTKRCGVKKPRIEEVKISPKTTPLEYPHEAKSAVYDVLRRHQAKCTCFLSNHTASEKKHLTRLLLPATPQIDQEGNPIFEMLFSSTSCFSGAVASRWQDVQFCISQVKKRHDRPQKRARFEEDGEGKSIPSNHSEPCPEVKEENFCQLLRTGSDARLCLLIQDGKLQRLLASPLKQILDHSPGMSLAYVIQTYHLAPKIKAALAYILAHAAWQFYDSEWMNVLWTSQTIQFIMQYSSHTSQGIPAVFASKPYFSVFFSTNNSAIDEVSIVPGEIHRFPRVRSVGIMLVEIGLGTLLSVSQDGAVTPVQRANAEWIMANQYSESNKPWPDFDYASYRSAVKNCLDPGIFTEISQHYCKTPEEAAESLQKRRRLFHDKVVYPLQQLVEGTGWKDELSQLSPWKLHNKPTKEVLPPDLDHLSINDNSISKEQKKSKKWLRRITQLQTVLEATTHIRGQRIRVAVLDTGYDADAVFFQPGYRRNRLVQWKDWVRDSELPEDSDGHGTHLVSLIMKIAPQADIHVARVAESTKDLANAADTVAQAIDWAKSKWKVDIVSMSFGYRETQSSISAAIYRSLGDEHNPVTFFAAASNSGLNEEEMFPARHGCVISVRGTNSNGAFQDFNPPRRSHDGRVIGTLGLDVPAAGLSTNLICNREGDVYKSGSSVAAAVAAGIAALLQGYVESQTSKPSYHMVRNRLRTQEGTLAMFESMSQPSPHAGHLYVAPWELMGDNDDTRWARFEVAASQTT